jgi:hypothetical protein
MPFFLDEAQVELSLVELIRGLGFDYAFGSAIASDGTGPERAKGAPSFTIYWH